MWTTCRKAALQRPSKRAQQRTTADRRRGCPAPRLPGTRRLGARSRRWLPQVKVPGRRYVRLAPEDVDRFVREGRRLGDASRARGRASNPALAAPLLGGSVIARLAAPAPRDDLPGASERPDGGRADMPLLAGRAGTRRRRPASPGYLDTGWRRPTSWSSTGRWPTCATRSSPARCPSRRASSRSTSTSARGSRSSTAEIEHGAALAADVHQYEGVSMRHRAD